MRTTLLLASLLFLSMFLGSAPPCAGEEQLKVAVPKAQGASGQEVEVPVTVEGAKELGCMQMALLYDETLLEVKAVDKGPLLPERAIFDHDKTIPGRLGLGFLSGPNANKTDLARLSGNGVVFNVRFLVLGRAGQKSPLTPHRAQAWEVGNEKLTVQTAEGEFTITGAAFPWCYLLLGAGGLLLLLLALLWARRHNTSTSSSVVS